MQLSTLPQEQSTVQHLQCTLTGYLLAEKAQMNVASNQVENHMEMTEKMSEQQIILE